MFRLASVTILLLSIFSVLLAARNRPIVTAAEPTINKASIQVTTRPHKSYFATPNAEKDFTTWSWTPRIEFRVNGPLAAGSRLMVEFTLPGNKPWIKLDCGGGPIGPDQWWQVGDPACGNDLEEQNGSIVTGTVDFKITLKNELQGADKPLFAGKINVKKFHVGGTAPEFKNNFEYYVDQDWNLPIGYIYALEPVYYATGGSQYVDWSPLGVSMWFRGEAESEVVGYLFYKGTPIGSTENTRLGTTGQEQLNSSFETSPYKWSRIKFWFTTVHIFNTNPSANNPDAFRLDKNPGEYEIKVLRNGKLARVAKFSVGPDGKIVDNGLAKNNSLGAPRMILPIQVLGTDDGDWDKSAWKTGAFYGNPLSGFTAP
jgi:hypothetical protein